MAEVGGVGPGGPGPVGPQESKKMYETEYKHAADLFQRALDEDMKSTNKYQKEEFHKVMEQANRVLNETAKELNRSDLSKQNQQIEQDYKNYQGHPDAATKQKLQEDLDRAKRSPF